MSKQREAFESWLCKTASKYESPEEIWEAAWQASRAAALEEAATVIELYDDATMKADYMLDSTECAGIIRALKEQS